MENFLIVVNALSQLAAVTLIFSILQRYIASVRYKQLFLGIIFGLGAVLSILQPITIEPGVRIDGRNLFLAFSGAFAGPFGAAVSFLVAGSARIYLGGIGVWPGIFSMFVAAALGLLWAFLDQRNHLRLKWLILAFFVSATIPLILLVEPPIGLTAFILGGPYLLVIYVVGSLALGLLLQNESNFYLRAIDLQRFSETDPLTGALNRRGLERNVRISLEATATRSQRLGILVAMVDIDEFKYINDIFGHEAGDKALQEITRLMWENSRPADLIARIGGDEFLIFAFNISEHDAEKYANRLQKKLCVTVENEKLETRRNISVSIGSIFLKEPTRDLLRLISLTDIDMLAVKKAGRNNFSFRKL